MSEQPIDTGFDALDAAVTAAVTEPAPAAAPKDVIAAEAEASKEPINFAEPISPEDNKQVTPEVLQKLAHEQLAARQHQPQSIPVQPVSAPIDPFAGMTEGQITEYKRIRALEDAKNDFYGKVMEARRPVPPNEQKAGPVPEQIQTQTKLEMEAGQAQNARHAEMQSKRKIVAVRDPREPVNQPVFRPNDYVPDRNHGYVTGTQRGL